MARSGSTAQLQPGHRFRRSTFPVKFQPKNSQLLQRCACGFVCRWFYEHFRWNSSVQVSFKLTISISLLFSMNYIFYELSVLGFMAKQLNVPINNVVQSGTISTCHIGKYNLNQNMEADIIIPYLLTKTLEKEHTFSLSHFKRTIFTVTKY